MIVFEKASVGTKVKCIWGGSSFTNKFAVITYIDQNSFSVLYQGGFSAHRYTWMVGATMFELDKPYRQATKKDFFVGAKARCVFEAGHKWAGRTATVYFIDGEVFKLKWDDNDLDDNAIWEYGVENFIRFFEVPCKKRKPKKVIPNIPLDPNLPILQAGYLQDRMRKQFR
jgi:hypothetical protein